MSHRDEVTTTRLTDAERAVCELAAAGLTNREIADRRCVSVKAVEFHLHNAYLKLQVRNRTQLALIMIEARQLDDGPASTAALSTLDRVPLGTAPMADADMAALGVASSPDAPPPPMAPVLSPALEDEAVRLAAEVLGATQVEIGDRVLDATDTERLHRYVAAGVSSVLERRHGLTSEDRASLEHHLLTHLGAGAGAGEPTASA